MEETVREVMERRMAERIRIILAWSPDPKEYTEEKIHVFAQDVADTAFSTVGISEKEQQKIW